jgi:hypothetical protein
MGRDDETGNAMSETGLPGGLSRSRKSWWRLRWLLVSLSAVLAILLVASGAVLIGVIIGLMAVVRAVMIVRWQRFGATLRARSGGGPQRA